MHLLQFIQKGGAYMKLIAAVDRNWGIGKNGDLLVHLKEDMKVFRSTTMGQVILIGTKTLESFPGGKPLPGRTNVVMTKNHAYAAPEDTIVCYSVREALEKAPAFGDKEVIVAGGGKIYCNFLPYCDTALITKVDAAFPADTFFPNLDEDPHWALAETSAPLEENGISYTFCRYERIEEEEVPLEK